VKTAISLPDDTYEQATRQAASLVSAGPSSSPVLPATTLTSSPWQSLTRQINEALQGASDDSNAAASAAGRRYLAARTTTGDQPRQYLLG